MNKLLINLFTKISQFCSNLFLGRLNRVNFWTGILATFVIFPIVIIILLPFIFLLEAVGEYFSFAYQPYLNKQVTFNDIKDITAKIKAKYKEKGYLTTAAFLPEQEIKDGRIEIKVIEGKMGKLSIEGNK